MLVSAYHLPALSRPPTATWSYGAGWGGIGVRIPQLTPAMLAEQIDALRRARETELAHRPVAEIVEVIGRVADRLLDRDDPIRREAGNEHIGTQRLRDVGSGDLQRPIRPLPRDESRHHSHQCDGYEESQPDHSFHSLRHRIPLCGGR